MRIPHELHDSFLAVIPGMAPGLVAILPQLMVLLLAALFLLLSPRTWWRIALGALRRPLATALGLGMAGLLWLGSGALARWWPRPAPGPEISLEVAGFPVGDRLAARTRGQGLGPLSAPQAREMQLGLAGAGAHALAAGRWLAAASVHEGRTIVAVAPLEGGGPLKEWRLEGELSGPLLLASRRRPSADETLLVAVTAAGRGALVHAIALEEALARPAARLDELPAGAAAVIDDRLLLVLERSIACLSLGEDDGSPPALAWRLPRERGLARAIAGDENGRYFLLGARLLAGDLASGLILSSFPAEDGCIPMRLAIREGLAYVLLQCPFSAEPWRIACVEAVGSPAALLWSAAVEAPLFGEIAAPPAGIAFVTRNALVILDPLSGEVERRLELEAPPAAPVAADALSFYLYLEDGSLLRYSPALGEVAWRRSGADDLAPPPGDGSASLLIAGRELIASPGRGRFLRLREKSAAEEGSAWGHWRGGPARTGAFDPESAPLDARLLWRWPREEEGAPSPTAVEPGEPLPLAAGWLLPRRLGGETLLEWVDDGGRLLAAVALEGRLRSLARAGDEAHAACSRLDSTEGDELLTLAAVAPRAAGNGEGHQLHLLLRRSLGASVWRDGEGLAACGSLVVAAGLDALRCFPSRESEPRWERRDIAGAASPLLAGTRLFAALQTEALALDAESGKTLWKRELGGVIECLSLSGSRLVALRRGAEELLHIECLDAQAGALSWDAAAPGAFAPAALSGERLVIATPTELLFFSLDGRRLAALAPGSRLQGPPLLATGMVVVAGGGRLASLDADLLEPVWESDLGGPGAPPISGPPVLARGRIVAPAGAGFVCVGGGE